MKKTIALFFIAVIFITYSALSASGETPVSQDLFTFRLNKDNHSVFISRQGLADIISFMKQQDAVFSPANQDNNPGLSRENRLIIWQTWQAFLDHILALDSLGKTYSDLYKTAENNHKKAAFQTAFAVFLAQYRYALDFIDIAEKNPDLHILLNEPVPELGLPENTYSQLKFRFLNVLRGAEFARLNVIYSFYGYDASLPIATCIKEDTSVIWEAGKGQGPIQTAQNAIQIVKDSAFTTWFPVQKGVSEWMGDTKVWRKENYLITEKQINQLRGILEPGDILLVRREWHLSNIGLPGFWTHAALYIGSPSERKEYFNDPDIKRWVKSVNAQYNSIEDLLQGLQPDAYDTSITIQEHQHLPRVIEAFSEGVSFTTLEHAADADSLGVLRPRLSKKEKAEALLKAFHYSGRPYDFNFDFLTDSSLVCSELIYKAYEPGATTTGLDLPLVEIAGRSVLPPNTIARIFDDEYNQKKQFDFIIFLDGNEQKNKAVESNETEFRKSWKRPKWHIMIPDSPLEAAIKTP